MARVIGLTGSLSAGKTTVASIFRKMGAQIIDADQWTHALMAPRGKCFKAVVREFGEDILVKGKIDRKKLGAIVFDDLKKLRKLEGIIHPVVRKMILETLKKLGKTKGIVILSVPLFFEGGYKRYVDLTMVVTASRRQSIQRACQCLRISKTEALRRIRRQMPQREKIRLADMIIDNNGTLQHTQKQVREIWEHIKNRESRN